ncbi:MAG: hypothetical protein ACE5EH_13265, partial [Gammaproteobacteria bacterium]
NIPLDIARPLGRFIRYGLTYLGAEIGGLIGVYLIGYLIVSLNTILTYSIIRHIAPFPVAVIGALAFCLFPADTTKILITHSLQLQVGLTFSLIAIILYQHGRYILPYILAMCCLLTYESTVLPLLAAPFLGKQLSNRIGREITGHVAIIIALLAIVLLSRHFLGETRVAGLGNANPVIPLGRAWMAMAIGPMASFAMYLYRPVTVLLEGGISTYLVMAVYSCMTFVFVKKIWGDANINTGKHESTYSTKLIPFQIRINYSPDTGRALILLITGIVLWFISYAFAFSKDHWPPVTVEGRMTSVHLAATFASALTVAAMIWFVYIALAVRRKKTTVVIALASVYFSFLAGFAYIVQEDLARSWKYQKEFWHQVISLVPDIDEKTTIFFFNKYDNLKKTKYIYTHSWANTIVLDRVYRFKYNAYYKIDQPVYRFQRPGDSIISHMKLVGDKIRYKAGKIGGGTVETEIKQRDLVVLYMDKDGKLHRHKGYFASNNFKFMLKNPSAPTHLPRTGLYDLIMGETG